MNDGGQLTEENIEMNYEEKYVRVSTPAMGNLQAMVLIHDYSKVTFIALCKDNYVIYTCVFTEIENGRDW